MLAFFLLRRLTDGVLSATGAAALALLLAAADGWTARDMLLLMLGAGMAALVAVTLGGALADRNRVVVGHDAPRQGREDAAKNLAE